MPNPEEWPNLNFPGWNLLQPDAKQAIRDFPVLWSVFELRATGRNGHRPNANPNRIREEVLALRQFADLAALRPAQNHFAGRYSRDGRQTRAFAELSMSRSNQDEVQGWLTQPNVQPNELLPGLLLIVNRLRNKYLRGEKAAYVFHDQFDNFRHANDVLMHAIPLRR